MAEESILSDDLLRQLIGVGEVDILVGLPTHNHAKTVGHSAQMIRAGLLKYFPRERTAILNADLGSRDGTSDLVNAASISDGRGPAALESLRTLHCISARLSGTPSKGTALQTIVAAADLLRARVCAIVSPESASMTPDWIDRLVRPAYRDRVDMVVPVYRRRAFDGILITNLLYPMTRAVFGQEVREPNPSDFAFSSNLGGYLMNQEAWQQQLRQSGAEFCFTAAAVSGGFRVQPSFLGTKERAENASTDLVIAMRQILGPLFWSLDEYYGAWSKITESQRPAANVLNELTLEPMSVNIERMQEMFRSGVTDLQPVLASILSAATLEELKRCAGTGENAIPYSDELWAKTVYEFAASYHRAVISRDHIIQALAPLYRGRVHTFLERMGTVSGEEVEEGIQALCRTFEQCRPTLLAMWSKPSGGA